MTDRGGYAYALHRTLDQADGIDDAIRITILNYMHDQLGLSLKFCEERVRVEREREIPRGVFDELSNRGWRLRDARLLDVGCGQGGALLEALFRGAHAYGVEPGREFSTLSAMRLSHDGFSPSRVISSSGSALPFASNSFDYVVSLQVLEHVEKPRRVVGEIFRVLKPGGQCYISCENYLAFSEQHYRVRWLPLLPKSLGAIYLRRLGRDPNFLWKYIYYVTYPQVFRWVKAAGFRNLTYEPILAKVEQPDVIRSRSGRMAARASHAIPRALRRSFWAALVHSNYFWRIGVRVLLQKPI